MLHFHKAVLVLLMLWVSAVATVTLATAQEATFSEGERLGLGTCLAKCPDGDKACNNRCISQSQTRGRVWSDDVRICIRDCRNGRQISGTSARMATDGIMGCLANCHLDGVIQ
jgi:hypothetical protein